MLQKAILPHRLTYKTKSNILVTNSMTMAQPNPELIAALQNTINKLERGVRYQWGHMGRCNCGLLVQELSKLSGKEIHEIGMEKPGDWATHSIEYCQTSRFRIDRLISTLISAGLQIDDLVHLERLDDPQIIRRLPAHQKYLRHNSRTDLICYLKSWLKVLEEAWLEHGAQVVIPDTMISSPKFEH